MKIKLILVGMSLQALVGTAQAADGAGPCGAPDFTGHQFAAQLAELHREILSEIDDGKPLPNKTVYRTPWRRDGAMVAMVLEKTGQIGLIRDWILTIDDPFDRNNGCEEPDNIGESLYLLGCVTNHTHPAVGKIVEIAKKRLDGNGVLTGIVDGENHPVYVMKWLKLGLEKCGLDASWVKIPDAKNDFYDGLFWMDGARDPECAKAGLNHNYPYLTWAYWHKGGRKFLPSEVPVKANGMMTWEAHGAKANYAAYKDSHPDWAKNRIAYPHTWHAAEMFLLLWEQKTPDTGAGQAPALK